MTTPVVYSTPTRPPQPLLLLARTRCKGWDKGTQHSCEPTDTHWTSRLKDSETPSARQPAPSVNPAGTDREPGKPPPLFPPLPPLGCPLLDGFFVYLVYFVYNSTIPYILPSLFFCRLHPITARHLGYFVVVRSQKEKERHLTDILCTFYSTMVKVVQLT